VSGVRLAALAACGAALLALTAIGLYVQTPDDPGRFLWVAAVEAVVYLLSVWLVWNGVGSRPMLVLILAVAGLARLALLSAPPHLSSDVYRYVWDGRVEAAGINPYRYVPADPHLDALRDTEIFPHINRKGYATTIYPPLAEAIFLAVTRISESVTAMKAAMVGFEVITIVFLLRLLDSAGLPSSRVLVYAWHPLPIWEFAGNGHVDAVLIAFVVVALWARQSGRDLLAGMALAGATLTKLYPAVLGPALYRRWNWRMPLAFSATISLFYLPFVGAGWQVFGFLPGYAAEEGFNATGTGFYLWSLVRLLAPFASLPAIAYPIGAAAILAALAVAIVLLGDAPMAGSAILASAFIVLVSPHYPWYFAWLIVFACFGRYLSLLWLTNACLLLYLVPVGSHIVRDDHRLLVESMIYGPFAALAVIDFCYHRRPVRST
jgi:alpha-1,6-mannosyltransferase